MGHGHHMVADLAGVAHGKGLTQMQGDLVAKEVEIDPGVGAATLATAEHAAVETAGLVEIGHVVGKMKSALHDGPKRSITGPVPGTLQRAALACMRAISSSVFRLRSALTFCTVGRSLMRAR